MTIYVRQNIKNNFKIVFNRIFILSNQYIHIFPVHYGPSFFETFLKSFELHDSSVQLRPANRASGERRAVLFSMDSEAVMA